MNENKQRTREYAKITALLEAYQAGDDKALERAFAQVYGDLKRLASYQLRSGPKATINTTSLVNELYLKLVDRGQPAAQTRSHFLALASRAMRQIIIDYARSRGASKRGGDILHIPLDSNQIAIEDHADRLLMLEQALEYLAEIDERLVKVVECRFFTGLTEQQTADALGVSLPTVQRDWKRAKAWLRSRMRDSKCAKSD